MSLRVRNRQASLRIRDNGVGIARRAAMGGGNGLQTMQYRARLIGAGLRWQRASPRGTVVICTFAVASGSTNRADAKSAA